MTATANTSNQNDFNGDVNNRTLANTTNFNHENKSENKTDKSEKNETVTPYTSRPLTFSTYRSYNGRARPSNNMQFKEENIQSYTDANGVVYKVSDHVYMDINKPNQPFAIAYILDFKLTKRDLVMIEVRWYYRPNEIPDGVYMPLMQDRLSENSESLFFKLIILSFISGSSRGLRKCNYSTIKGQILN
ncbi:unnamed protein product [Brachionus calyciflorus]|uniref:BAH domain-containing protein n=1 Tax=Brachionus calyciflorus TaxID=104777 RepID=A0A813ZWY0_9BILA|nr:unnamed protein product [Brachionus calyciflorus]